MTDGRQKNQNRSQVRRSTRFFNPTRKLAPDSLEVETLRIAKIHIGHFKRIIGQRTPIRSITRDVLQDYINKRSADKGRGGKNLSAVTVKKELGTLSAVWRFAKDRGDVDTDFPIEN